MSNSFTPLSNSFTLLAKEDFLQYSEYHSITYFGILFANYLAENIETMKRIVFIILIPLSLARPALAQEKRWTMEECMRYAVENSPKVKKQTHTYDTYKAEYTSSIGSFFPSLQVGTSASYNFGRSVDLKTNTYISSTFFGNSYYAEASLPLFDGGQVINQWRLAKINRQLGMNNLQKEKDDLALRVLQAYVDVVYYQGVMQYAAEKLEASRQNLYKVSKLEELGLRGRSDVVQIEAEVAGDDYLYTRYQNVYNTSLSTLKEYMNYPIETPLEVDTSVTDLPDLQMNESAISVYDIAKSGNPTALQADLELSARKKEHLIQKGRMFPTISIYGGINSRFSKDMKTDDPQEKFRTQFKNNMGEYVGVSLSIPLFSRLNIVTSVRRARNNVRIAEETQTEVLRQLQTAIEKAVMDRTGYAKEAIQMEKKKESDEHSYQVTLRKFEEGLMSPLDVQTNANTLMESKANLLQRKLMYVLKCKEVDYYKGTPFISIDN